MSWDAAEGCVRTCFPMRKNFGTQLFHGLGRERDTIKDSCCVLQIIITEACKVIQEAGKGWKPAAVSVEGDAVNRVGSLNEGPAFLRSPSKNLKVTIKLHLFSLLILER